jgi:hypothetical protein
MTARSRHLATLPCPVVLYYILDYLNHLLMSFCCCHALVRYIGMYSSLKDFKVWDRKRDARFDWFGFSFVEKDLGVTGE